jgi:KilA-N domain
LPFKKPFSQVFERSDKQWVRGFNSIQKFDLHIFMNKNVILKIDEIDVSIKAVNEQAYISLTDIARLKSDEPKDVIANWMRLKNTIQLLGFWESRHNPDFKGVEFDAFKNQAGENAFTLSPQKWIETTNAVGLMSKSGRYGGGTYAHKHIALAFAAWVSAEFNLTLMEELDRLKSEESQRLGQNWDVRRELSKINYHIQTDAIQKHITPQYALPAKHQSIIYASEADLLNKVLFDMTAAEWRLQNPEHSGNIRDTASDIQLVVLANLESHNAELIKQGINQEERLHILEKICLEQLEVLMKQQQKKICKKLKSAKNIKK